MMGVGYGVMGWGYAVMGVGVWCDGGGGML